ncbi:hypothetical protein VOLCADRAFT_98787 [Volvox carteri f. nagariensis]|uniref:Uncharacterized protein n=1 Tax=Volvox carteri f. nagariensis TaxID=3068 RepID=D8UGA8_VOLCA|nr:uncharacterized protein VOLCADRAFT_98787 [Volvox carteri f. nagariensis]EFJ41228.1 hypothetical protein VOLCADRAFT_98787 [Volvox carteri f. nagariensis]|eukprot:XP_002957679.1 hypothetical protein VOLCADRAFT_98787 [Volvox carteri f. nagariensis]
MDGHPSITSNAQQLRVVKQLLWEVISLHLYPAERDEIRRALGTALLDDNETLFAEAGALADILGDVTLNTSALLARHQLCSNPQRSMVETEIRLLIERLHASAAVSPFGSSAVKDRDPDSLLPRHGKRDRAVLDYMTTVAQVAGPEGRGRVCTLYWSQFIRSALSASNVSASISLPSPLSRPGTASPTLQGSRPSTAASSASASSAVTRYTDAPSVVAGLADKLNVASIDTVRETLRTALLEERTALLEDVEYLQGLLDVEADLQVRATVPPPSLAELKDYSSRLAAVVTNEEARLEHEVRVKAMFAAAEQQQSKPGRLRGMVDASRRPTSGGAGAPSAPARRSSVSGGAQTLVVHHGGDEQVVRQQSQRLTSGSSVTRVPGAVAAAAAADGGSGGSGPPSRAAQLLAAPLRRPGSGGSSGGAAASVFAPPPVLLQTRISTPPSADGTTAAINRIQAVASSAAALTAAAPPSPPDRNNLRPVAASSAAAAAAVVTGVPPPSSTSSPLLQARNHTSQQHPSQQHSQTANQPQLLPQLLPQTSYREKSPSRRMPPSPARHAAFTTAPLGPSTSPAVLDSTGAVLSVAESGGAVKSRTVVLPRYTPGHF